MRPLIHFTPPANWLNDPNGLVHYGGEYHLCYQHYPHSADWGPMHWGHAVSRDLLTWEHLPIALAPDENGMIFSGSAVVDWQDTAGFGREALIAIYTIHREPGHHETQGLAFSLDQGRSWTKYPANPILPNPGLRDIRDPKVFWHDGHWVMCLAAGREIRFCTSSNLKDWELSGVFAPGDVPDSVVLETPDLFELPVAGSRQTKWILSLGVSAEAPAGGSGSRYFIGGFDGATFRAESAHWMDYGPDFYAPQSWSDTPDGRRITLGWMSDWRYARQTPAESGWRGMFSIPRELTLIETENGPRLAQRPIAEVEARRREIFSGGGITLRPGESPFNGRQAPAWDVTLEPAPGGQPHFEIQIHSPGAESTRIFFDYEKQTLSLDRSRSGAVDFHPGFAAPIAAPLPPGPLRLLVDVNSLEIFAAGGQVTLSAAIFPSAPEKWLEMVTDETLHLQHLTVFSIGNW
jgi:fructan beta-fructosidase